MSDQSTKLVSEGSKGLESIGFKAEEPERVSFFSLEKEDSPVGKAPSAQFVVETDSIGLNMSDEVSDGIGRASNVAHELVHYNLSNMIFGETSDDFRSEVDELMEAREAFVLIANENGYDVDYHSEYGKNSRLNALHLEPISLATENIGGLKEILNENSPSDGMPFEQIRRDADGLVQEHYPLISDRKQKVYESGGLPYQEPFAYFAELHISGQIDSSVKGQGVGRLGNGFREVITKDFQMKPESYFGSKDREEVTEDVGDMFNGMLLEYQNMVRNGYSSEEAASEVMAYSEDLG